MAKAVCYECSGRGWLSCPICEGNDDFCEECKGGGEIRCYDCDGTGIEELDEEE